MLKKIICSIFILLLSVFFVTSISCAEGNLLTYPFFQAEDSNGVPLSGGLLNVYEPGTSTRKATYSEASMLTATVNPNPVVLDTRGEKKIFYSGKADLVLTDSDGVTIWTDDDVYGLGFSEWGVSLDDVYACDLADAISGIGATVTELIVDCNYTMDSNDIVASTTTLKFVAGNKITRTGYTLTVNSQIEAGPYQIFDGSGTVSYGVPMEIWADWHGKTAAGLQAAYNSAADGSTIKMSGGTWAFGTTTVTMTTNNKTVHLKGIGYDDGDSNGTNITYTSTNEALKIAGFTTVENLRVDGGSSGAVGITFGNSGGSPVAWKGSARNLFVTGCTTAGIKADGIQLGYMENVYAQSNDGAGMIVEADSSGDNTHCVFNKCRFASNTAEGVVYSTNSLSQFKYYGCIFESNGEEGVKATDDNISGTIFDGCWFENNKTEHDTDEGTTEYQVNLNNNGHDTVTIKHCEFRDPNGAHNGTDGNKHVGFDGKLILEENRWSGTLVTNSRLIGFTGGSASWLYNKDKNVDYADLAFNNVANRYYNLKGYDDIINYTSTDTLSATLWNCTITNAGASGAVILTNNPVKQGQRLTYKQDAEEQLVVKPDGSDRIYPLGRNNGDGLLNLSNQTGDSLVLNSSDGSNWVADSVTGQWGNSTVGEAATGTMALEYDFADDGGAQGDITLGYIPINSVIKHSAYDVVTAFTSGGAATIALGIATDDAVGIKAQQAYNHADYAAGYHDGIQDGTAANFSTVTTNNRAIVLTIGTADITAGKLILYIEYLQTPSS